MKHESRAEKKSIDIKFSKKKKEEEERKTISLEIRRTVLNSPLEFSIPIYLNK